MSHGGHGGVEGKLNEFLVASSLDEQADVKCNVSQ
jgi:hypothetical protein